MTTILSVSKSVLALLITIVTAGGTLFGTIIPQFITNATVADAVVVFASAIVAGVVVYLTTQEQVAPAP